MPNIVARPNTRTTLTARERLEERVRLGDLAPDWTRTKGMQPRAQWWWRYGAQLWAKRVPHNNAMSNSDRPLRVGYVSGDFNLHSACTVFGPIAASHSAMYRTYCYSSTPWHGYDPSTAYFAQHTRWRDVLGWDDVDVANLIREDQIDILVDCSGFTPYNRLSVFAMGPAPVQINAWGYVYPTGFPCFDAIFSDAVCIKEDEREGIEPVVELPCVLYYADREIFVEPNALPCLTAPPVFGTYNRIAKVDERVMQLWKRVLDAVPGSTFILKTGDKTWTPKHERLRELLGERVTFMGATTTQEHAYSYGKLDLNLDPIAMNGGVTSLESLWMGVPMVTLPGAQTSTRMSETILRTVGLDEFVAQDEDDYVRIAVGAVTTGKAALAATRAGLRARMRASPLCAGYVQVVENEYRKLWQRWCAK